MPAASRASSRPPAARSTPAWSAARSAPPATAGGRGAPWLLCADADRLDHDRRVRAVGARVGDDRADLVDHVLTARDLAEQRVVRWQLLGGRARDDEELRARRSRRLGPRLGHGHDALGVLEALRGRLDHLVARAARAVALRVAALDDEARDNPVEARAVVEALVG